MTTPFVREMMRQFSDQGGDVADTHWFDISGASRAAFGTDWINWLRNYQPPFDKCVVVYQGATKAGQKHEFIMTVQTYPEQPYPEKGTAVAVGMLARMAGESYRQMPPLAYLVEGDRYQYWSLPDEPIKDEEANLILSWVTIWYRSLSQGTEAYVPTARDTFTNRRKIAQGKLPIYEWRTVVVTPRKPYAASESKGGTHASPRQHDRRGHLRHLRNGKDVWVRPCKVGDPSKGAVFHDYEVRPA